MTLCALLTACWAEHTARRRRDAQTAARLIDEARIELTQAGARAGVAASLHARAEVHRMNGDLDAAEESYREARERLHT